MRQPLPEKTQGGFTSRSPSPPPHHAPSSRRGPRKRNSRSGSFSYENKEAPRTRFNRFTNAHNNESMSPGRGYEDDRRSERSYRQNRKRSFHRGDRSPSRDSDGRDYSRFDSKIKGTGDRIPEKLDPEMRQNFPFRIFIKDEYLREGLASRNEMDEVIRESRIKNISMDTKIQVPEVPG
mmetsp:Transcript_7531/g.11733  ORF Transcript_7531/g.11733 Transcript_7531/m.11733 type:complete len:179 (-) Transcript_7531:502-1038(-)